MKEGLVKLTRRRPPGPPDPPDHKPLLVQQDQSEVLEEVGATRDDDSGELVASEDRVREIGAVDADAVRENARMKAFVDKKRGGVKNVTFNTDDPLLKYEMLIALWAPNTIDIYVRRLTGAPAQHVITSRPRSGAELYEAMKIVHGAYEEAAYELKFTDNSQKVWRGSAKITMPDTRSAAPQGQPPMNYPYYPPAGPPGAPGYPPPPGYPPVAPVAPAPPPAPGADLGQLQQLFELFTRMQRQAAPPQPQAPPQPMVLPPPPTDPAAQMAWMQQAFEIFQRMQAQPGAAPPPLQPTVVPVAQPTSGLDLAQLQQIFGLFREMMTQAQPAPAPPPYRRPYDPRERGYDPRDPRDSRGYDPREQGPRYGEPEYGAPGYRPPPPPYQGGYRGPGGPGSGYGPPAQPRSHTDELREAVSFVRTAAQSLREMQTMMPWNREAPEQAAAGPEEDDSPVQVVDAGPAKFVINKEDGGMRGFESVLVNLPSVMKWGGEQFEKISKAHDERQRQAQPPRQQLAPGYVEVTPGYRPPPGFVAVPIDQEEYQEHMERQQGRQAPQRRLPDPPERMPPPIHAEEQEEGPYTEQPWGAPPSWGGR